MSDVNCDLIATLPNLGNEEKVRKVLACPQISEARYNTGSASLTTPAETVALLKALSSEYAKKIWLDIKGRQLRIVHWADPQYEAIELNHSINVVYPAKIYFRNGDFCNIVRVKGNKILLDPLPREALGAGQSVNILAREYETDGYLTELDKQFLRAAEQQGLYSVMASFVERREDLFEILSLMPKAEIISKIESVRGIAFISSHKIGNLMAARDDLFIQTGQNKSMLKHLTTIINSDSNAICASRIFSSLERQSTVEFSDISDLVLMQNIGYKRFMLCDNICNYHFDKAIAAWRDFTGE
jgi:pyruvate kinase